MCYQLIPKLATMKCKTAMSCFQVTDLYVNKVLSMDHIRLIAYQIDDAQNDDGATNPLVYNARPRFIILSRD